MERIDQIYNDVKKVKSLFETATNEALISAKMNNPSYKRVLTYIMSWKADKKEMYNKLLPDSIAPNTSPSEIPFHFLLSIFNEAVATDKQIISNLENLK